jgi:hypothetical protein
MSNVLKPKRSWTANAVPTTSDLSSNEVAFNFADNKLFVRNPTTGNIVSVALGGGGSSSIVTASTVAGFPATGTAGILYVALDTSKVFQWQGAYLEVGAAGGSQWSSVPSSASATGSPGQTAYDGLYQYVCVATNVWGRVAVPAWDSYYSSVSLLLAMDGSNNSTVFTDYGPSARAVTANGNAKISTAQSKFGGSSAFFDGTGDFLSVANSDAFDFGSGDFAIEAWIYIAANSNADADGNKGATICNTWNTGATTISGWIFAVLGNTSTTGVGLQLDSWNAGNATLFRATASISQSAWHHVAASVVGGTRRIYLDGVLVTNTQTIAVGSGYTQVNSTGNNLRIGNSQNINYPLEFNGYIDDLRITKGNGRGYTGSTITVPTAASPRS